MAVTYDNSSWQQSISFPGTTVDYTYVTGGSANVLYVWVHWGINASPDSVSGITYNSVALTRLGTDYDSGSGPRGSLWRLKSPTTGSNTLTVTQSGITHAVGIISLNGADLTTTEDTIASDISGIAGVAVTPSLPCNSAVNDLVLGFLTLNGTTTNHAATGTGSTLRVSGNTADSDGTGCVMTQDAVAGTTSGGFSWTTNATGVHVRFAVKAASVGITGTGAESVSPAIAATGAYLLLEQEGFRFYNDDGSESGSSAAGNQDTNVTFPLNTNLRLRMIVNATGDPANSGYRIEYRKVGESTWIPVTP